MSIAKLSLQPRKTLEFEYADEAGRLTVGRPHYRATFLDQTEKPEGALATIHGATKRLLDGTDERPGLFRIFNNPQPPMTDRTLPFTLVSLEDVPSAHTFFDAYAMFPGLPIKIFGEKIAEAEKDLGERVKQMYLNSLENEQNFRNAFYLNRLVLNAVYFPMMIHALFDSRKLSQEDDKSFNTRRAIAGTLAYALRRASFEYDDNIRDSVKSKFSGADPHPYLNGTINEFVLSGMEPSQRAIDRGLSYPNTYGITPVVYAKIKAALNKVFEGKHDQILADPGNLERLLNDAEAMAQIRTAMGDAPSIVAPVEAVKVAREHLRRRFAEGYPPQEVQKLKELQGYVATDQAIPAVELLLKGNRKDFYARHGIKPGMMSQIEKSAERVASPKKDDAQDAAVRAAVSGYSKIATASAVYYDLRRILGTPEQWKEEQWKNVRFVTPETTTVQKIADDFNSKTIYVFSGNGRIFNKGAAQAAQTGPGIVVPADDEDIPVVGFLDIRKFTDFIDEHGETSGGTHILKLQDMMADALIDSADAEIGNRAGDGLLAIFSGQNAVQRYLHATSRAMDALAAFNEVAEKTGDALLKVGIGGYTGKKMVIRRGLRVSKTDKTGSQYISGSNNIASRFTSTAHQDLADLLEMTDYMLPIDLDDETLRMLQEKKIDAETLKRRKSLAYRLNVLVTSDGRFHNTGNVVAEPVVERLKKELPDGVKRTLIAPVEKTKEIILTHYFDPKQGMNVETPHLEPVFEVLYFHDAKNDGKPIILRKLPHEVAVKGIKDPTIAYEVVPSNSFMYEFVR